MATRRFSKQRELIYRAVCDSNEHPTAETVYNWLKPDNPALSLGTVYRNLNQLVEDGSILRLPFPVDRYDGNTSPHVHFLCTVCGKVYDLSEISYNRSLDKEAERVSGHVIVRHQLVFEGICASCSENEKTHEL